MKTIDVPVLVVGAGPVGVAAGILLAQHGLEARIVERHGAPHRAPQAHVVNPRTLEICRALGVDLEAIRARATPVADGGRVRWVTTVTGHELGSLPYERQDDGVLDFTPTPLANISQHLFEPILLDRLAREPRVSLNRRHQWESCELDADGVTSTVRDLAADTTYTIRSKYLLACDGAGSRVRARVGIDLIGPERIQSFVMIHFEAALRRQVAERPAILYWVLDPNATGAFVAHDIDRTWVFMHPYDPDRESLADFGEARCRSIVHSALGSSEVPLTVKTVGTWTMTAQVADRYGEGRVFLLGDAAHRFPPSGGLGLNTGIQDAHNLVWKIRAVEDGLAAASLLESYETERKPVAQRNAEQSFLNAMKLTEVIEAAGLSGDPERDHARVALLAAPGPERDQLAASLANQQDHFDMLGLQLGFSYDAGALIADGSPKLEPANPVRELLPTTRPGSRLPHAWLERAGTRISSLDLIAHDRFTLLHDATATGWAAAVAALAHPWLGAVAIGGEIRDGEGHWARVREIDGDGAILVRPDGHVAWRSRSALADPAAALGAAMSRLLG